MSLNFKDCRTKIRHVDAHATLNDGVVVQVMGELSNNRQPMRRFMQTFVLAPEVNNLPYSTILLGLVCETVKIVLPPCFYFVRFPKVFQSDVGESSTGILMAIALVKRKVLTSNWLAPF